MSFADPLWLLALAVIPLGWLLQRGGRARARRYAVRFTATASALQAVGTRARWQRWPAVAAALLAFTAATAALARPRLADRVPIGDDSLMLVLDHSGSMAATDVSPTRIAAAISAANQFIGELPSNTRVGAVGFGTSADSVQQPSLNHGLARNLIDSQTANGGTDTGPALLLALSLLGAGKSHHPPAAIVLLSDGAANLGEDPVTVAAQAKQAGIPIYTVALGTPNGVLQSNPFAPPTAVPPDPALMQEIASTSGGRAFDAQTADQLSSIYTSLGNRLSTVAGKREITAEVAIAAAVLLLLGGVISVRTSGRLP